jgi:hypothetical protein
MQALSVLPEPVEGLNCQKSTFLFMVRQNHHERSCHACRMKLQNKEKRLVSSTVTQDFKQILLACLYVDAQRSKGYLPIGRVGQRM